MARTVVGATTGRAALAGVTVVLLAGLGGMLAACGDDEPAGAGTSDAATASASPTSDATSAPPTGDPGSPSDGSTGGSSDGASDDASPDGGDGGGGTGGGGAGGTGGLPGEPIDLGYLPDGAVVGVVGVAFDDVLNVRELPGARERVVGELAPLADDVVSRGQLRLLPGSIWAEVEAGDVSGWVNTRYLGHLGSVEDLTAEVVRRNEGEIPSAGSMEALGLLVAEVLDYDDPQEGSRIVMTAEPSVGDLGEVTYDVVGVADDSLLGWRLHVFGTPDEDGGGFSLKTVEATLLCGRGVTDTGICV